MPKPSLLLNAIVRNENDRILRCLSSVAPYIKSYSILDTGSTDGTTDTIRAFFDDKGIKGHIHFGEFKNFSQARNDAFVHARDDNGRDGAEWCQFALLADADMELRVTDDTELLALDARAPGYDLMQKAGPTSYANRRILNLEGWKPRPYVGVTHEYIDVPSSGMIKGACFVDHADGSNRVKKFDRDIALLEQGLKDEPDNIRYIYYLANSYRDAGRLPEAIEMYERRIAAGGWEEERHDAMMNLAFCHKESLNFGGFVDAMLQAYNYRPQRVEPLYELAKVYRERNQQRIGLVFAKAGLNHKRPDDLLFINDFAYEHGIRYEYSILGFYDAKEQARAFEVTDDLALDPTCPESNRSSAKRNLFWHLKPLNVYCPSFLPVRLDFTPPPGYTAMNPAVEECNGKIKCNIRCVNYKINEQGQYMIGELGCQDAPIDTRNFLARLDVDLRVKDAAEIVWDRPPPKFPMVTGLEDIRLYHHQGDLCFSACIREQAATGVPQQIRGTIDTHSGASMGFSPRVSQWGTMTNEHDLEKNWMPIQGTQDFVYRLDKVIRAGRGEVKDQDCKVYCGEISGGSQVIPFKNGYIAVVHEASVDPTNSKRTYWHRFAWFTRDMKLKRLSLPFVFFGRQIEFCCGLAYHPDRNSMILSFGVRDEEAWVAKVSIEEVAHMCWKFHENT